MRHDYFSCTVHGCPACENAAERRRDERDLYYDIASDDECEAAARDMIFGRGF